MGIRLELGTCNICACVRALRMCACVHALHVCTYACVCMSMHLPVGVKVIGCVCDHPGGDAIGDTVEGILDAMEDDATMIEADPSPMCPAEMG